MLPSHCVCGQHFTVEHALSCSRGGCPTIRHNEIRNITANLMSEVCPDVGIEPTLQPVTEEHFQLRTTNREDGARLDVVSQSFWSNDRQSAFFDVRVFNPFAPTYRRSTLAQSYKRNEMEKKRAACKRNRTWIVYTFSFFCCWRYGSGCSDCLQETSFHAGRETRQNIQHYSELDEMQTKLLPHKICNNVHQRLEEVLYYPHTLEGFRSWHY